MKTFSYASLIAAALAGPAAAEDKLLREIATCAGRLSATLEHQWLVMDPASDATQAQRDRMVELLAAVQTRDSASRALARRIEAKYAHAALLQRATFGQDTREAEWARQRAKRQMTACSALILTAPPTQTASNSRAESVSGTPGLHKNTSWTGRH
ncbi:hypothetical protein [Aestuariicoccus sp. MJ-SS9]|uniref:hypothetical protein n=1 Tax=Aestuariicoccus sp. MJ-SS9 TaxID=3079855 RepID=UPI00291591C4|nr:hypothetical protein [Aestuariicoccus sp. MJ-SS9]MDU8910298.1 hypothetical protein [Aestuariicoccus sp. MJ-SS9]